MCTLFTKLAKFYNLWICVTGKWQSFDTDGNDVQFKACFVQKITFVLRKINKKLPPPELHLLTQMCTKSFVCEGFAPDLTRGAYSASGPLAVFRGTTSKWRLLQFRSKHVYTLGNAHTGMGKGGALAALLRDVKCYCLLYACHSKTLSRRSIYALFSQHVFHVPGPPSGFRVQNPNLHPLENLAGAQHCPWLYVQSRNMAESKSESFARWQQQFTRVNIAVCVLL